MNKGGKPMDNTVSYIPAERKAIVGAKEITVRSLVPVFQDPEEYEQATQKVQDGLFKVFHKYMDGDAS